MNRAAKISAAINAIRRAAGNSLHECPTCGRSAAAPARRIVGGEIVEGCVDAYHHGHLPADSAAWHNRPYAQQLRAATLATLRAA